MPANAPQRDPKGSPPQSPVNLPAPNWRMFIWYIALMLLMLWVWQDVMVSTAVKTIPYSEFKQRLSRGEVVTCELKEDEIVGRIAPKNKVKDGKTSTNAAKTSTNAAKTSTTAGKTSTTAGQTSTTAASAGDTSTGKSRSEVPKSSGGQGGTKGLAATPKPTSPPVKGSSPRDKPDGNSTGKSVVTPPTKKANSQGASTKGAAAGKSKSQAADQTAQKPFLFRTVRVEDPHLVDQLEAQGVDFAGMRPGFLSTFLMAWVLPIGAITLLWVFLSRRFGAAREAIMNVGRSHARLVADTETGIRFGDVAGCDEAKYELQEVVSFLKDPNRYETLGAKIPKGVLLVGPPGTGKTMLAKAVAGEAGVPFFSLSGSDFVEMFVGVGAARVRDLFQQAKKNAPCIVFVDEVDAVGRQRGVRVGSVNDEREQTLNQLLAEMDGFDANVGVILLAATNRPEVLDLALLRPGRFDRQILVDLPDMQGREAILRVHARDKRLSVDVDLSRLARRTPGFSGADLANALNEAALLAARRGSREITQVDLDEAAEKVVAGPERRSRHLGEEARRRVAFHEVGHALVAACSQFADPVQKISIVPRGRAALGSTLQLPDEDQYLATRSQLFDRLKGLLGGRTAEEIIWGEVSTGAENDLQRATAIARQMICSYGMSETIGLVHCGRQRHPFLPDVDGDQAGRDCSELTAQQIDQEVKQLLDSAHQEAQQILTRHRDDLERVADELLEHETIDGSRFLALIGQATKKGKEMSAVG